MPKYIVYMGEFGLEVIVVFAAMVKHSDIAKHFQEHEIVSAGFVKEGRCCGKSDSLGLESRDEDQDLFNVFIRRGVM